MFLSRCVERGTEYNGKQSDKGKKWGQDYFYILRTDERHDTRHKKDRWK